MFRLSDAAREAIEYVLLCITLFGLTAGPYYLVLVDRVRGLLLIGAALLALALMMVSFVRRVADINRRLVELERRLREEEVR